MVPHRLHLRNFMSYGNDPVDIDFDTIHLACLSGGNGNGKSALLDAITWVLWGRSRAKREDDLVAHGATEMEVELEFSVGDGRYRAIRKRTMRRGGGSAALELHLLNDGASTSMTGATIAETQDRLIDILKLGYETFINSTFLLQGRADEFTVKPPAQRKAVLANILGLEEYDTLAEQARDRARTLSVKSDGLREGIKSAEEELTRRPLLLQEYAETEEARARITEQVHAAERGVWEARAARQRLEEDERTFHEAQSAKESLHREIATLHSRLTEASRGQEEAAILLRDEDQITAAANQLRRVREELATMGSHAAKMMDAQSAVHVLRQEIQRTEDAVRSEQRAAEVEAERSARMAAEVDTLRQQVEVFVHDEARLVELDEQRMASAQETETLREQVSTLHTINASLEGEMAPLRERLKLLREPGALCPLCQTPMSEEQRQRLGEEFRAEGTQKNKTVSENKEQIETLQSRLREVQEKDKQIALVLTDLQKRLRQLDSVRHRLQEAEQAAARAAEFFARAKSLAETIRQNDFGRDIRERLQQAEQAMNTIGYDATRHTTLRAQEEELIQAEEKMAQLATARERHANATAIIVTVEDDLRRRREDVVRVEETETRLHVVLQAVPQAEAKQAAAEAELESLRFKLTEIQRRVAALTELLRILDEKDAQVRSLRDQAAQVEQEGDAYAELSRIFGKGGIQAMIIDTALPDLEEGANTILGRMSDNSMQVQFVTQAQGVKKNVIETLDIRIADANGTRPYEMFSGGEAFRVNFAIRISLSRLLAERAGTQLQMLVIDEGFGTQDSIGRERLVQAITSVADDFEKIIVITHIDELKDLFSTRIEVVKEGGGSRVVVTAA